MNPEVRPKSIKEAFVILASKAEWRSRILDRLGIPHRCVSHKYEEPIYTEGDLGEFVQHIALNKAKSIETTFPSAMIVSSDQLVAVDGEVLGKPGSRDAAMAQLLKLKGCWHELFCGLAVIDRGKEYLRLEKARLKMRDLSHNELTHYLDRDQPFGCCGAYKIESLGGSLFERIEVQDPDAIIGLPSIQLIDLIRDLGYSNLL